jgi:hypothetical protein
LAQWLEPRVANIFAKLVAQSKAYIGPILFGYLGDIFTDELSVDQNSSILKKITVLL